MANKPTKKFSNGAVSASVWDNERKVDGKEVTISSVTLTKSYKDKNDKWQNTNSLNVSELPQAISVLQEAYQFLSVKDE